MRAKWLKPTIGFANDTGVVEEGCQMFLSSQRTPDERSILPGRKRGDEVQARQLRTVYSPQSGKASQRHLNNRIQPPRGTATERSRVPPSGLPSTHRCVRMTRNIPRPMLDQREASVQRSDTIYIIGTTCIFLPPHFVPPGRPRSLLLASLLLLAPLLLLGVPQDGAAQPAIARAEVEVIVRRGRDKILPTKKQTNARVDINARHSTS